MMSPLQMIYLIIAATVFVSFICFKDLNWFQKLKFNAWAIVHDKDYKRLLSYGFVHADWVHLFFNMYVLYSFSRIITLFFSQSWGEAMAVWLILGFYLSAIVVSTLSDVLKHRDDPYYNAVGASGAVSAFLFSAILLYPQGSIQIMFVPIGIPAPFFGLAYLFYCWYMGKRGTSIIGHNAHFWGAVYGIVFTVLFIPSSGSQFMIYLRHLL